MNKQSSDYSDKEPLHNLKKKLRRRLDLFDFCISQSSDSSANRNIYLSLHLHTLLLLKSRKNLTFIMNHRRQATKKLTSFKASQSVSMNYSKDKLINECYNKCFKNLKLKLLSCFTSQVKSLYYFRSLTFQRELQCQDKHF